MRLLFKSGYYLRVAFIKLRGIATATDAEIEEPDPFANIDKDENELEENEVVLYRRLLVLCFLLFLNLNNICFITSHEVLFRCACATQIRAVASVQERPLFCSAHQRCGFCLRVATNQEQRLIE